MLRPLRAVVWCAVSTRAQNEPEKFSLPQQESDGRAIAEREGWFVVDVMTVPGHSRRYLDFGELAATAAHRGIEAFAALRAHWAARDFDVLIVRDGDRFARTQALHAFITESTINAGARIYSLTDGWIDHQNYRLWTAMGGYRAAGDIDRLVNFRRSAMHKRAERGLSVSSRIALTHMRVRDPANGKELAVVLNPDRAGYVRDLVTVFLKGTAYFDLDAALNEMGHRTAKGQPFAAHTAYRLLHTPMFWGHAALGVYRDKGGQVMRWTYDDTEDPPEGVIVWRNVYPSALTGEVADAVIAELKRRADIGRGNARASQSHRFTGLCVCARCGAFTATFRNGGYHGQRCPRSYHRRGGMLLCENTKVVNNKKIQAYLDTLLRAFLKDKDAPPRKKPDVSVLDALKHERGLLEGRVTGLIRLQADAPDMAALYAAELQATADRLRRIRIEIGQEERRADAAQQQHSANAAARAALKAMTLTEFWKQDDRVINQTLHRILGRRRISILNGEVVGTVEVHRRQRRHD